MLQKQLRKQFWAARQQSSRGSICIPSLPGATSSQPRLWRTGRGIGGDLGGTGGCDGCGVVPTQPALPARAVLGPPSPRPKADGTSSEQPPPPATRARERGEKVLRETGTQGSSACAGPALPRSLSPTGSAGPQGLLEEMQIFGQPRLPADIWMLQTGKNHTGDTLSSTFLFSFVF